MSEVAYMTDRKYETTAYSVHIVTTSEVNELGYEELLVMKYEKKWYSSFSGRFVRLTTFEN